MQFEFGCERGVFCCIEERLAAQQILFFFSNLPSSFSGLGDTRTDTWGGEEGAVMMGERCR